MREPEEEVHGGLDLHLHRARAHLSQPLQSHVLLHGQGGRDVPGSGESWHEGSLGLFRCIMGLSFEIYRKYFIYVVMIII